MRKISGELEPYPAVIFPAGANLIDLDDPIVFEEKKVFGFKEATGEQVPLDVQIFFPYMRNLHFSELIDNEFGLFPENVTIAAQDEIFGNVKISYRTRTTLDEVQDAKKWIQEKLQKRGLSDSLIVVRNYHVTINVKKRKADFAMIEEQKIELDD